jgi:hypothetical protein
MSFAWEEVVRHNTRQDCWIVLHGVVYDVSDFLGVHPGGSDVIFSLAGRDATATFAVIFRCVFEPNVPLFFHQSGRGSRDNTMPACSNDCL